MIKNVNVSDSNHILLQLFAYSLTKFDVIIEITVGVSDSLKVT